MSVEERRLRALVMPGAEVVVQNWAWLLALGIILSALGIVAIGAPVVTSLVTALFVGWLLLIGGLVQIVHAFKARRWGGFFLALLAAVLYLVVGALLISFPVPGVLALTLLLGLFFLLQGAFEISFSFALHDLPGWGWLLASGLISLVIAFLILANWPSVAAWAIGLLVGVGLLWGGLARILIALSARRVARHLA